MLHGSLNPVSAHLPDIGAQTDPLGFARRLHAPIWVYDIDNFKVAYANDPACHLWQATSESDLIQRDFSQGMSPNVIKRLSQYQEDFLASRAIFNEMWTLYPNGQPLSVMVHFSGFVMPDGRMGMLCEVTGDTAAQPENLRSTEALLHTDVMITLYCPDGHPLYRNPAARNAAFHAEHPLAETFVDNEDYAVMMLELGTSGEHRFVAKIRSTAGPRWYDLSAKSCLDAATGKPAILVTAIDVSELKIARDKARYLADRDQLTGCYNRAFLQHYLGQITLRQSQVCALLYVDIDRFKQINDQFGHDAGDHVLKEVSARIQAAIRPDDVLVRLGGDEFIVLIEPAPDYDALVAMIEKLRIDVAKPMTHEATRLNLGASVGVSCFTPSEMDFAAVMREADIALYAAKEAGRNCCIFFSDAMGKAADERDRIETELKTAIANQDFVLYFQPRVDLRSGKVVSAEALVRWQHPTRGLIMPDKFIPICEETGMIEELGQLVIEMGCQQAIDWQRDGFDIALSINISPRQFSNTRIMQTLQAFSDAPGFPHGKIELEITENALIGDHDQIAKKLEAITRLGYCIAIDDFGTGYSNLSYISRFPLTCLKIDRSFISQLPKSGPIVHLILALGRQIGATIVAEGVENTDELNWLKAEDCDQVQGFLLAKPTPLDQFLTVVDKIDRDALDTQR